MCCCYCWSLLFGCVIFRFSPRLGDQHLKRAALDGCVMHSQAAFPYMVAMSAHSDSTLPRCLPKPSGFTHSSTQRHLPSCGEGKVMTTLQRISSRSFIVAPSLSSNLFCLCFPEASFLVCRNFTTDVALRHCTAIDIVGVKVWLAFTTWISLQGCKWHKPEGCPGPRLRCPFCLVLPCLTILQKISNHLEMVKGNSTMHHIFHLCGWCMLCCDASAIQGIQHDSNDSGCVTVTLSA